MNGGEGPTAAAFRRGRPGVTLEARKLGQGATSAPAGTFSYRVMGEGERAAGPSGERRRVTRLRTKLRSGKLVQSGGQFISECLVHNRSASGCRLRLPTALALPSTIYFFEDQSERLFQAVVMWQKHRDVGLRLLPAAHDAVARAIADRMRRKFYVLPG